MTASDSCRGGRSPSQSNAGSRRGGAPSGAMPAFGARRRAVSPSKDVGKKTTPAGGGRRSLPRAEAQLAAGGHPSGPTLRAEPARSSTEAWATARLTGESFIVTGTFAASFMVFSRRDTLDVRRLQGAERPARQGVDRLSQ